MEATVPHILIFGIRSNRTFIEVPWMAVMRYNLYFVSTNGCYATGVLYGFTPYLLAEMRHVPDFYSLAAKNHRVSTSCVFILYVLLVFWMRQSMMKEILIGHTSHFVTCGSTVCLLDTDSFSAATATPFKICF